jgi:hypothetical protein
LMGRPVQNRCRKAGHPYDGARNKDGAQICKVCIRKRKRRRYWLTRRAFDADKLLRVGLGLGVGEHERLQEWQRRVWAYFERLDERADAAKAARRNAPLAKAGRMRVQTKVYVSVLDEHLRETA